MAREAARAPPAKEARQARQARVSAEKAAPREWPPAARVAPPVVRPWEAAAEAQRAEAALPEPVLVAAGALQLSAVQAVARQARAAVRVDAVARQAALRVVAAQPAVRLAPRARAEPQARAEPRV